jgi:histidinol phosphatase-like enzyme
VSPVQSVARALFLDFGGTLAAVHGGRTAVDAEGTPVLMPHVADTLARVRPTFDHCFIVSNQARIARGEITEVEVLRRFSRMNRQLGGPFTDWRICPHHDGDGCLCRRRREGTELERSSWRSLGKRARELYRE